MLRHWRDAAPTSAVYDGPMVEPRNMFIWTWDARPYPEFPRRRGTWRDGALWHRGHWLTGRLESAMLPRLVERICREVGLDASQIDVSGLYGPGGLVRGLMLNSAGDHRGVIETLAKAYQFDAFESGGKLKFQLGVNTPHRRARPRGPGAARGAGLAGGDHPGAGDRAAAGGEDHLARRGERLRPGLG